MTSIPDNAENDSNDGKYLRKKEKEGQGYSFKIRSHSSNLNSKTLNIFPLNEMLAIIATSQNVFEVSEQCHYLRKRNQFSPVAQWCPTLCDHVHCSTPGFTVYLQLPELPQTHVHWVGDAIQLSHPLLSPSPAFSLSQHRGLFKLVSSSHQVAKVLQFQLQHQSFQWIFKTNFL